MNVEVCGGEYVMEVSGSKGVIAEWRYMWIYLYIQSVYEYQVYAWV